MKWLYRFHSMRISNAFWIHRRKLRENCYDTHVPSGFCCLTVSTFPEYNNEKPYVYSGSNVMDEFFKYLKREQARINKILAKNEPMKPLTADQTINMILVKIVHRAILLLQRKTKYAITAM